jgi:hypothetical protein
VKNKDSNIKASFSDGRSHFYTEWEKALGEQPEKAWLDKQEKKKENVVALYARLYDSQSVADAEKRYVPDLEKALAQHSHTIKIQAFKDADGGIEALGIDIEISAPADKSVALGELVKETLRISGAPYATQVFAVLPDKKK